MPEKYQTPDIARKLTMFTRCSGRDFARRGKRGISVLISAPSALASRAITKLYYLEARQGGAKPLVHIAVLSSPSPAPTWQKDIRGGKYGAIESLLSWDGGYACDPDFLGRPPIGTPDVSMTCHSTIWQVGYDNTDSCSGEPPDLKGDLSRTTFTHSPDRPPSEFSSAAAALRTRRPEDASLSGGIQTSRREVGMYHHSRDDRLRVYRKEISVSRVSPQYDCEPQVNDLCLVAVFRS
ncbi:hypothetical protein B0H19DRAFT_1230160 [Mycena capillaripes]|nr:hypothetical protein B0H19DRAFT_1230160 [Mycena capillaripes]